MSRRLESAAAGRTASAPRGRPWPRCPRTMWPAVASRWWFPVCADWSTRRRNGCRRWRRSHPVSMATHRRCVARRCGTPLSARSTPLASRRRRRARRAGPVDGVDLRELGGHAGSAASGRAWAVFADDRAVAVACPFFVGREHEDIGVVTERAYRGRGLSTSCAAAVIDDIRGRGRRPTWTTGEHGQPRGRRSAGVRARARRRSVRRGSPDPGRLRRAVSGWMLADPRDRLIPSQMSRHELFV